MGATVQSFEPVIDERSKVLILGSLPSVKSLALGQYYGNPKNQFWKIVYHVFGRTEVDPQYEDRKRFILENHLALWDVFAAANRKGSLDSGIKNEGYNDIPRLLRDYPNIRRIAIAGGRAAKAFHAHFPNIPVEVISVPSTSPIPGKNIKTLDEKIKIWREAIVVSD